MCMCMHMSLIRHIRMHTHIRIHVQLYICIYVTTRHGAPLPLFQIMPTFTTAPHRKVGGRMGG